MTLKSHVKSNDCHTVSIFNMEHQRPRPAKFKRGFKVIFGLQRYKMEGKHKEMLVKDKESTLQPKAGWQHER